MTLQDLRSKHERCFSAIFDDFGFEILPGWANLVDATLTRLSSTHPAVRVTRIKEKFGTLRIGVELPVPYNVRPILHEATRASETICETCGKEGILLNDGNGLQVRCSAHEDV